MKINKTRILSSFVASVLFAGAFALVALAAETDSRIVTTAQKSYVFRTYLKNDDITTQSQDGVVTLTGSVSEESHRSLAEDTVANLPGVKRVDNQLVVKGDHLAGNSDTWIGAKVKTALLFHPNVNSFKTQVHVQDGIVTLTGEAASQAQKDLAGEYAKDVAGVKEVKNEMTVAPVESGSGQTPGEKIDDASITAEVKAALLLHQSTSAVNTRVSTTDGVVTVSGVARNDAEKALVTKLVNDTNGVTKVVNNMTIAAPSGM